MDGHVIWKTAKRLEGLNFMHHACSMESFLKRRNK